MTTGAIFGELRRNRYVLFRIWDEHKPKIMFIGLNPSTANESKNDNTITKVIKIANNNGFGGVYMANLFSCVTPYPKELNKEVDIQNDLFLIEYAEKSEKIVFAWGNFKEAETRAKEIIGLFPNQYCLYKNKNGSPKHPLYCKDTTQLIKF